MGNYHIPCGAGEKLKIIPYAYLLLTLIEGESQKGSNFFIKQVETKKKNPVLIKLYFKKT